MSPHSCSSIFHSTATMHAPGTACHLSRHHLSLPLVIVMMMTMARCVYCSSSSGGIHHDNARGHGIHSVAPLNSGPLAQFICCWASQVAHRQFASTRKLHQWCAMQLKCGARPRRPPMPIAERSQPPALPGPAGSYRTATTQQQPPMRLAACSPTVLIIMIIRRRRGVPCRA